jgi:hypothetical protein
MAANFAIRRRVGRLNILGRRLVFLARDRVDRTAIPTCKETEVNVIAQQRNR